MGRKEKEEQQELIIHTSLTLSFNEGEIAITFINIPLEMLHVFKEEESIKEMLDYKYYLNTLYDKIRILNSTFMITRKTKTAISLIYTR